MVSTTQSERPVVFEKMKRGKRWTSGEASDTTDIVERRIEKIRDWRTQGTIALAWVWRGASKKRLCTTRLSPNHRVIQHLSPQNDNFACSSGWVLQSTGQARLEMRIQGVVVTLDWETAPCDRLCVNWIGEWHTNHRTITLDVEMESKLLRRCSAELKPTRIH